MEFHERSESFEDFLAHLNEALLTEFPVAGSAVGGTDAQIFGLPRSGTTVLNQLFAATGRVGYPSNLMAMFWQAPWVGARLQARLALTEPTLSMNSLAGRTREPLDPHEFGYFWRGALGHSQNRFESDLPRMDGVALRQQLAMVHDVFGRPVVYKNFLVPPHLAWLREALPQMRYLHVQRPELDVAASLLSVRRRIGVADDDDFGPLPTAWDPPDEGSVHRRIARQVRGLARQVESLVGDAVEVRVVPYAELCADTRRVMGALLSWLGVEADRAVLERLPAQLPVAVGEASADRRLLERELFDMDPSLENG